MMGGIYRVVQPESPPQQTHLFPATESLGMQTFHHQQTKNITLEMNICNCDLQGKEASKNVFRKKLQNYLPCKGES